MKNLNEVSLTYIELDNLSQDTNYNMSTGLIYAFAKFYNDGSLDTPLKKLQKILENK
jgi:hypothetical protein